MRAVRAAPTVGAWILVTATLVIVGVPDIVIGVGVGSGLWKDGVQAVPAIDLARAARSLLAAGLVGVLAVLLGWPVAWAGRGLSTRWVPFLGAPLLMPSYLAYASLNQLRAPGTWLGDWLLHADASQANLKPIIAARIFAIVGLALWAWPIAALVLMARVRRLDAGVLDALQLEPMSRVRRALFLASMLRAPILIAFALVTLVMLGSALPFHLAQLDTYAISLWRILDESAPDQRWRAWAAAWPLILLSIIVAVVINWRLPRDAVVSSTGPDGTGRPPSIALGLGAAAIWASGVLLPIFLFARHIRVADLVVFWRSRADAIGQSLATAAWVAAAGAVLASLFWLALSSPSRFPRWAARVSLTAWLVLALVPGVLVGSVIASAWNTVAWTRVVADTSAIVVLTHLTRFGFITALLGWWLFRSDPQNERDLRRVDGVDTPRGWFRAAALPQLPVLLGGAIVLALLSLHEIEASIFVQPPGSGLLAQAVLELLHFERRSDLSAAAVTVMGGGILLAAAAATLLSLGRRGSHPPAYQQQV